MVIRREIDISIAVTPAAAQTTTEPPRQAAFALLGEFKSKLTTVRHAFERDREDFEVQGRPATLSRAGYSASSRNWPITKMQRHMLQVRYIMMVADQARYRSDIPLS